MFAVGREGDERVTPVSSGAISLFGGKIEETLNAVASRRGARVASGVRLDFGDCVQDYPYILIDQFGLLVIDVQIWPGTRIKGSGDSKTWTAKAEGTASERLPNPIHAGRRRLEILGDTLLACGRTIAPEYFSFLVVFAGADLSGISVSDDERVRVVDVAEVAERLDLRYDFAMNAGVIEPSEVEDLASLMRTLDRSDDPLRAGSGVTAQGSAGLLGKLRKKAPANVAIGDSYAGVAPVAPRLLVDRYPDSNAPAPQRKSALPVLLLVLGLAVIAGLYFTDGMYVVRATFDSFMDSKAGVAEEVPPIQDSGVSVVTVEAAQRVLLESAPDVYAALNDRARPDVTTLDGYTTFTWALSENRPAHLPEETISLTFDGAGDLRGAKRE